MQSNSAEPYFDTSEELSESDAPKTNFTTSGRVYWITGLSGSGKTTIGTRLYYYLKTQLKQVVLLDGDVIKRLFGPEGVDYSREGRRKRAFQYSELCKLLSDQGITVICCAIAMFDEVREWNRVYISNYHEIFIDVGYEILVQKDTKGLYKTYGEKSQAVVGAHSDAEFPKHPDVIIQNTMDNKTDQYVAEILSKTLSQASFGGKEHFLSFSASYWDNYYKNGRAPVGSSDFAVFALNYMEPSKKLIDLGCGNGRDSLFFCKNGLKVTAVDLSKEAIQYLNQKSLPIFAVCDNFVTAKVLFCVDYDYCYARWSIHAINKLQQDELILNVSNSLQEGGLFFIEARTVNDSKFGMGKQIGACEFIYDGHYRRFINPDELVSQLISNGFDIIYVQESDTFSVVEGDAPTLVRAAAKKRRRTS